MRVVLVAEPRLSTSLIAAAYASLVSAGGGAGRNWSPRSSTNGVTRRQVVKTGVGKFGGVGRYSPGFVPATNACGVMFDPSFARIASRSFATWSPRRTPFSLAGPSGTLASSAA